METPISPKADIGVLLVHGIGNHREGETLLSFGDPILDWLREWRVSQSPDPTSLELVLSDARLQAIRTEKESPAFALASLDLKRQAAGDPKKETWLLCEGWWGGTVLAPPSFGLLRWISSRAPLLIYWHFAALPNYHTSRIRRFANDCVALTAATALALLVQAFVTVAMGLWWVPIGRWRRALVSSVNALTATLGDSHVLLENEIQRAALVSRVRESLCWASQRSTTVIVVAHSQGAAIAHDAIRGGSPSNLNLVITLGSGLEKLEFLRLVKLRRTAVFSTWVFAPVVTIGFASSLLGVVHEERALIGFGATLLLFGISIRSQIRDRFAEYRSHLRQVPNPLSADAFWWDIYASHDMVPMPTNFLFTDSIPASRVRIVNERSISRDHITYFAKASMALPKLWQQMGSLSAASIFGDAESRALEDYERHYVHSAIVLSLVRLTSFGALAVLAIRVCQWVMEAPLSTIESWSSAWRSGLVDSASSWIRLVAGSLLTPDTELEQSRRLALALAISFAIAMLGALWTIGFHALWRHRVAVLLRSASAASERFVTIAEKWSQYFKLSLLLALGLAPSVAAVVMAMRPEWITQQVISFGLSLFAMAVLTFFSLSTAASTPMVLIAAAMPAGTLGAFVFALPWLLFVAVFILSQVYVKFGSAILHFAFWSFSSPTPTILEFLYYFIAGASWPVWFFRLRSQSPGLYFVAAVSPLTITSLLWLAQGGSLISIAEGYSFLSPWALWIYFRYVVGARESDLESELN